MKIAVINAACASVLMLSAFFVSAAEAEDYWNTADHLNRRTCADTSCGVVGSLYFREKAQVFEVSNGWARITEPYDAACVAGNSRYVDSGDARCIESNGVTDGEFSEWVSMQYLSKTRPADPSTGATGYAALVGQSDDFRAHKQVFAKAAKELIESGQCSRSDFEEWGGWMKSTNRPGQTYFMYCGGASTANRLYLDAATGKTFR